MASVPAQDIHYAAAAILLREYGFGGSDAVRKEEKSFRCLLQQVGDAVQTTIDPGPGLAR